MIDLGRLAYAPAHQAQCDHLQEVLAAREAGAPEVGRLLLVEHDPVITIGRRPGAARHLVASPELLAKHGVAVVDTDRGGDITYHGPGQLVAYPIIDLNTVNLGLHDYMRLLEAVVIETVGAFGVQGRRDPDATGVWVGEGAAAEKLCAMGVRVRRWVTMHGLALNVTTTMEHFGLIVPCGLAGRPVTSLERLLGPACPPIERVKDTIVSVFERRIHEATRAAAVKRAERAADASALT